MEFSDYLEIKSKSNIAWVILKKGKNKRDLVFIDGPFFDKEDALFMIDALEMLTSKKAVYFTQLVNIDTTVN